MASGRDHWARLRRQLWRPPRAHGEQPRERVVGPLELLHDLVVVVLVAQAAHHLAGHLTWSGTGAFIPEADGARGAAFAVNAEVLFAVPRGAVAARRAR
ncbi:hypothetical protein [Streptomyces sp. NPDC001970]